MREVLHPFSASVRRPSPVKRKAAGASGVSLDSTGSSHKGTEPLASAIGYASCPCGRLERVAPDAQAIGPHSALRTDVAAKGV